MDTERLQYEIQKIDGSPESVLSAVNLLFSSLEENNGLLPKSVEHHFFEEVSRSILDRIGKGMDRDIHSTLSALDEMILFDEDHHHPLAGLSSKRRLSIMITLLCEIMSVYLRTDFEWKNK